MASDVDAVIGALRVVLADVEARRHVSFFPYHTLNRWINRLPGSRWGRWRDLKIKRSFTDEIHRDDFIAHLRATLTYLEINRDHIKQSRAWWPFARKHKSVALEPIDVDFKDVPPDTAGKKTGKAVRLIKGGT